MQSSVDLAQKVVEGNRRVEGEVVKGEGLVVVRRQQAGRFQLRYQCSFRSKQVSPRSKLEHTRFL